VKYRDDTMRISENAVNAQKQLDSREVMARRVVLKIKRADKTEYMMVGN
jgi:hypothetical protein